MTNKKNIYDWLNEYSLYHKNATNKLIHWICIPFIILSLFGLLSIINFDVQLNNTSYSVNVMYIFILIALIFYIRLSITITIGMLLISLLTVYVVNLLSFIGDKKLFQVYILLFIISWIVQFIGHKIEGKKPAFVKDLKFLLIGPAWLLSFIYIKFKIKL